MEDNKFSIVVPVYNREDKLARCLQSLISQTYGNFEVIVIDDGSIDNSKDIIKSFLKDKRFRAYFLPQNSGRIVARNIGMRMARNEWICWLDSDDEYMSNYLEVYNDAINKFNGYKIFNSGMLVKTKGENEIEDGWRIVEPLKLKEEGKGMGNFEHGKIGTGSFIFHSSLRWYFPEEVKSPYGDDNSFPAMLVKKDKIFSNICRQNENGQWLSIGNPWGDDYSYFWYLTRFNKSKCLNNILYIQHVR